MPKYPKDYMKIICEVTDTAQLVFHEIYSRNMFCDTCGAPSRFSADATHIAYHSPAVEKGNVRGQSRGSR